MPEAAEGVKKRVLVADNEVKLRNILERVLGERGYEVRTAANGKDALGLIPGFNPHLVIAEVAMPEMNGFELCRRIRSDNRFRTTRFIFLTAKDTREDEIEGLMLGADDYIIKPFDVQKLLARVDARLRWVDKIELNTSYGGVIEGSLGGRNLIDIFQVLEIGQKSGELTVNHGQKHSRILLSQGRIVSAVTGKKKGKLAVYTALTWTEGRFCFTPVDVKEGEEGEEDGEQLEITTLILEWARIADELLVKKSSSTGAEGLLEEFISYIKEREKEGKE